MRVTHQFGTKKFVPGSKWQECDECGFDYLTTELRRRWDGFDVCPKCYEPKHPLDEKNKALGGT